MIFGTMPLLAALLAVTTSYSTEVTEYARRHCIFSIAGTVQRKEPWMRSPAQIVKTLETAAPKTIVIHFHGGLVDTETGLLDAQQLGTGLYKDVAYPIHFIWESGAAYATAPPPADWKDWGSRIFKSSPAVGEKEGPYPVPIVGGDSVALRPLMMPMRSGWRQIKRYAELTCDPRIRDAAVPTFLDSFLPYWQKHPETRVVLVSHSAGSFLVGHMLELMAARYPKFQGPKFDLVFVAPACTYEFIGLRSYLFGKYVNGFKMYGLSDDVERKDLMSQYLNIRGVNRYFPGSILYLVSNHLEERHDTMVLGMQRFQLLAQRKLIDRDLTAREQDLYTKVDRLFKLDKNATWGPSPDCDCVKHTDFFYEARTRTSLRRFLQTAVAGNPTQPR